jgi:DNA-binding LacI/PurR family transcriptional regulator
MIMPTIKDVAKRAGVSISTVSYVLSGVRPVSEETKLIVHTAMDELAYHPHAHARALASKRSHILALLIPPTRRGLGETEIDFVTAVSQEALARGYHTILWTSEYDDQQGLREFFQQGLVDGILLMEVHTHDPRIPILQNSKTPFVLIGRCTQVESGERVNWTDIDFEATLFLALQYLIDAGHHSVAFINQSKIVYETEYGPVVRTYEAFNKAKTIFPEKIFPIEGFHYFCEATSRDGYLVTSQLLQKHPGITAIIAMNDRALPGIYRAINESHRKIPDDISVMGIVSSARTAELFYPALTTLDFPATIIAKNAVAQLIAQIEGSKNENLHNLLRCELQVRESTGPCRFRRSSE